MLCLDIANGYIPQVGEIGKKLRKMFGNNITLMTGNIVTKEGAIYSKDSGFDFRNELLIKTMSEKVNNEISRIIEINMDVDYVKKQIAFKFGAMIIFEKYVLPILEKTEY